MIEARAPGTVHFVDGSLAYASSGSRILESRDAGSTWETIARLPLSAGKRLAGSTRILRRLLRSGVSHLIPSPDGALVALGYGRIFRIDPKVNGVEELASVRGRRPLSFERRGNDLLYGEYRPNPERTPVSVWKSGDGGRSWEAAWTFDGVRHVHGVFSDPRSQDVWVTTGDDDHESGLWVSRDAFVTLDRVRGGTQQFRVVRILFDSEYVYFGTDTPRERNHIYRMDRQGNGLERLAEVGGSVFHGAKQGEYLFFSTACEPSRVNTSPQSEVWASRSDQWLKIVGIDTDPLPMKLFQYGQILFPAGVGQAGYLWLTPFACQGDQVSLKIRLDSCRIGQVPPFLSEKGIRDLCS